MKEFFKKVAAFIKRAAKWVGVDGLLHFTVSALLVVGFGWVRQLWIVMLCIFTLGIAKEIIYDYAMKKGTPEWKDIICDAAGILAGALFVLINHI